NRDRMDKMIEHGLVPNVDHRIALDDRLKRVRPKCTERDSEKAECGSNTNEDRHDKTLLTLSNAIRPLSWKIYPAKYLPSLSRSVQAEMAWKVVEALLPRACLY